MVIRSHKPPGLPRSGRIYAAVVMFDKRTEGGKMFAPSSTAFLPLSLIVEFKKVLIKR